MPQVQPSEVQTFASIKVVGIGGAGGSAINRMKDAGHGDELADAGGRRGAGVAHAGGHQAQAGRRGHLHQPGPLC